MKIFSRDRVTVYQGDSMEVLKELPACSVQCCVTSPPYYGLRDYGTGEWEGGSDDCDHKANPRFSSAQTIRKVVTDEENSCKSKPYLDECGKCGAKRVDKQIGLETTPDEYVEKMVLLFREVRRVLRNDGTLWLNIGDSYARAGGWSNNYGLDGVATRQESNRAMSNIAEAGGASQKLAQGLKQKDLCGIPWRVAFALQADGWYLRQDIIWSKPNPMPESVTDRCTKAHEYVFLLSKSAKYYYDADAIKEPQDGPIKSRRSRSMGGNSTGNEGSGAMWTDSGTRNRRSVWTIATKSYPKAHFATFPPTLVEPCIQAGTSLHGCCATCGAPWVRVTDKEKLTRERPNDFVKRTGEPGTGNACSNSVAGVQVTTTGWEPTCLCDDDDQKHNPCVVLDPFLGSGTTAAVAQKNGCECIGIELNPEYAQLAVDRFKQKVLF